MKKSNDYTSFSSWLLEKRKKRRKKRRRGKSEVIERYISQDLVFQADSSGFTCVPYRFSNQLCDYIESFEANLKDELDSMKLDEFNGDFKKKELELIGNYENIHLEGEYIDHLFTNLKINSQLLSQKEVFENEIALVDNTFNILKMEVEDYEEI